MFYSDFLIASWNADREGKCETEIGLEKKEIDRQMWTFLDFLAFAGAERAWNMGRSGLIVFGATLSLEKIEPKWGVFQPRWSFPSWRWVQLRLWRTDQAQQILCKGCMVMSTFLLRATMANAAGFRWLWCSQVMLLEPSWHPWSQVVHVTSAFPINRKSRVSLASSLRKVRAVGLSFLLKQAKKFSKSHRLPNPPVRFCLPEPRLSLGSFRHKTTEKTAYS